MRPWQHARPPDPLLDKLNLALEPFGETLRASRTPHEIGKHGRYYTVDRLGRIAQTSVCLATLAVELGVLPRRGCT